MIELVEVKVEQAEELHAMQKRTFLPLLHKYMDDDTNPANEPLDRLIDKIRNGRFYTIIVNCVVVGAIRIVQRQNSAWISPIFVLPEFQGRGIAQRAIRLAEGLFPEHKVWELQTILQEQGNCRLYEKMGYKRTEYKHSINSRMTLVGYMKKLG
ncbi:GNAT family N-acetyltransferase [Paenibacillus sp. 1011MAR3C5]|uniref:GNAT family N-acetyltransferase n=1 Tax=Paenibacillus sp. 1011MAR3C5 TaxID=1675787 RepID=UPI002175B67C|nr:GNAT family N-acetyltransferase [Paenibacillus sp. 1011MAR3C5]